MPAPTKRWTLPVQLCAVFPTDQSDLHGRTLWMPSITLLLMLQVSRKIKAPLLVRRHGRAVSDFEMKEILPGHRAAVCVAEMLSRCFVEFLPRRGVPEPIGKMNFAEAWVRTRNEALIVYFETVVARIGVGNHPPGIAGCI
jgi:hypothetical protein